MSEIDVGIVGAGLAGLYCARQLADDGLRVAVFEADDHVGGRVTTDEVQGFLLDRGFQVLLSSYPEARAAFDFDSLGLEPFRPGSLVRKAGKFWRVVDPWRAPLRGLATIRAPFVSIGDALRMASLRRDAVAGRAQDDSRSAQEFLRARGFSAELIESFFRPFFGGVTLDTALRVPAWYLMRLFGWFATGEAVVPARGMRALGEQLAAALPADTLHLGQRVARVEPRGITLSSSKSIACRSVVVATDATSAARLLGEPDFSDWSSTTTVYYGADASPVGEPILVLNGEGAADGPANHVCVLSDAQPSYAPAGRALVSVSANGARPDRDEALDASLRTQLGRWFGARVGNWELRRIDRIRRALPRLYRATTVARQLQGVFVCGDHVATPSIQGTLESGRLTARAVKRSLLLPSG